MPKLFVWIAICAALLGFSADVSRASPIVTAFGAAQWQASDATLGIAGATIEDFEDTTLVSGLQIQLTGSTAPYGPTGNLPLVFDPTTDDPNAAKVLTPGVWDGSRVFLNRKTAIPVGYVDF